MEVMPIYTYMRLIARSFLFTVCLLTQTCHGQQPGIPLVINEFLASNSSTVKDGQSEWDDWIELHNLSDRSIDAAGMYLTDNLSVPAKWRIPSGNPALTTIPARGYLLIWADGDTDDSGLHASFQLGAEGDEIGLLAADGRTLIDAVQFGRQRTDISFGRSPDGSDDWGPMIAATPGRTNGSVYPGVVSDPMFSHDRGFYVEPFDVTITGGTDGATIVYTLDGSSPAEDHGQ